MNGGCDFPRIGSYNSRSAKETSTKLRASYLFMQTCENYTRTLNIEGPNQGYPQTPTKLWIISHDDLADYEGIMCLEVQDSLVFTSEILQTNTEFADSLNERKIPFVNHPKFMGVRRIKIELSKAHS